jgi:hypothetical protein
MQASPLRAPMPKVSLLLAVLSAGCALQVHEGDGLASDGREVTILPAVTDAGPPKSMFVQCKQFELFKQVVMPVLTAEFQGKPQGLPEEKLTPQSCVSCHNDKLKAIAALLMDPTQPAIACQIMAGRQVQKGDIIASSDPDMPLKEHEFKFQNPADYTRFRDAVQMWITAEGFVTLPQL